MAKKNSGILMIIIALLIPPLAVGIKRGIGTSLLINIILTIIGWVPGVIHAIYVLLN